MNVQLYNFNCVIIDYNAKCLQIIKSYLLRKKTKDNKIIGNIVSLQFTIMLISKFIGVIDVYQFICENDLIIY